MMKILSTVLFIYTVIVAQSQSAFPCEEFFSTLTNEGKLDTVLYYSNGQVKADGMSLRDFYSVIDYPEYDRIPNRKRVWKEYYPTGSLKFVYKYPPKGIRNMGLFDLDIHFGRGRFSKDVRLFPVAFFYRPNGTLICKGGLEFDADFPWIEKTNYWNYFDENGHLICQEYFARPFIDTSSVHQVFIEESIPIPEYFAKLFDHPKLKPEEVLHVTNGYNWRSEFNNKGSRVTFSYHPKADDIAIRLDNAGNIKYLKFSYPYGVFIDSLTDRSIRCLTVERPSFHFYNGTFYNREEFRECGLCIEDSCRYFFYDVFELHFENDSLVKSYGYFQDCDGGQKYKEIGHIYALFSNCFRRDYDEDVDDYLIKREEISTRMRELFGEEELKAVYDYIDETFDNLFPK